MTDSFTITRTVASESMLFRALREKGIESLQKTTGSVWTDHNVHDPGITILEALSYVITEIANQLNFSFADLIATPKGIADAKINYPSAALTLPCKAVTITDFRKIISDILEIRNAFFEITTESRIPVYLNPVTKNIDYNNASNVILLPWGGLYSIQLEMEDDKLNTNTLSRTIPVTVGPVTKNIDVIISFKYWDEVSGEWFKPITITNVTLEDTIVILEEELYEDYYSEWKITFSDGSVVTDFPVWIKTVVPLSAADPFVAPLISNIQGILSSTAPLSPFAEYKTKLEKIQGIIEKAKAVFHNNRNLGEDISYFSAVRLQEIAMNAAVEISPVADPVETFARIIFTIESFFSPRPKYYSLEQLLAKNIKTENIFLGPLLNSGFLPEAEFNSFTDRNVVYVSDLVHIILDVKGTLTLRDISLNTYFNNFQAITNERNCLRIQKGYKPRLSISRTVLTLTRNGIPIKIDQAAVDARLTELRNEASAPPPAGLNDLPVPFGSLPAAGKYRSVQYELPSIYGTGAAGISRTSSPLRKAQLKQLQGYLFLFDQLLANTFSQLENIGDLFSIRQQGSKTYYDQLLYHVPGTEYLFDYASGSMTWVEFMNAVSNEYTSVLKQAGEPGNTFFERRNAMLDYLLARTAENRQDYAAIQTSLIGNYPKEIILHEKENFLVAYPSLSMARAQGYNYTLLKTTGPPLPDVWDSENTGGYVRMVAAKLGFVSNKERSLYNPLAAHFQFFGVPIKYRLKDATGNLMTSENIFLTNALAEENIALFIAAGRYIENYTIEKLPSGKFSFRLLVGNVKMKYSGATQLLTEQDAKNKIIDIVNLISEKYSLEGLHVVEHILLRPRIKGATDADSDKLFDSLIVDFSRLSDPYSHVVTVILPSGLQRHFGLMGQVATPAIGGHRWRNPEFVLFAQQTILREAPAHLLVNIFFLDIDTDPGTSLPADRPSLQNFEAKWKEWRERTADPAATVTQKRSAQRNLVTVLESIYDA